MSAQAIPNAPAHPPRMLRSLVGWLLRCSAVTAFGGRHRPDLAFAEIVLLWLAVVATLAAFRRVSHAAAWLLAPYLARVSFAAALNFTLWRLNP